MRRINDVWHGIRRICSWSVIICLWQCANPIGPSGGPDDKTPPELQVEESTPNLQTNVKPEQIVLKFDEWVVVKNPTKEIIVSPPLKYKPKVGTKGKGVVMTFDEREVLRDSTTYVINYGKSIQDLTANNPFADFSFVFSSGNQLDKQKVSGRVVDAYTGEPAKDAIVVLYDQIQDSIVFKERPVYYATVQEDGTFLIDYLREDTFLIFALIDANRNYYWDQEAELFGYYPDPVFTQDTFNNNINFSIYKRDLPTRILQSDDDQHGKMVITINGDPTDVRVNIDPAPEDFLRETNGDSLIYYIHPADSTFTLFASYNDQIDTIKYKPSTKSTIESCRIINPRLNKEVALPLDKKLALTFNYPLISYDLSYWSIIDTTGEYSALALNKVDSIGRKWLLDIGDDRLGPQELMIMPGGWTDFYNRTSEDTTILKYTLLTVEDVSRLKVDISGLDSMFTYIIDMLQGDQLISTRQISNTSVDQWEIEGLLPQPYTIRIVEDRNLNGKWDGGDYKQRLKPEKIIRKEVESLRANWDVDVSISW